MFDLANTPHFIPKTAPKQVILLLHGVGADGNDLLELQPMFSQALPDAAIISPHAFDPYEHAQFGRQWFSLADMSYERIAKNLPPASQKLSNYIDELLAHFCLDPKKLAILGFSQGAMLGLHHALSRKKPLASLIACSGALIVPSAWQETPHHLRTPISITHGALDEVVPISQYHSAMQTLTQAGWPVKGQAQPSLGHSIDYNTINFAIAALKANLA